MTIRGLGWIPDAPDERDWSADRLALPGRAPAEASLAPWVVSVLDQGPTSSCVAHAVAQALRIALAVRGMASPPLPSRLALYWAARAASGHLGRDEGTTIRAAFAQAAQLGLADEKRWPWESGRVLERPPWDVWQAAIDARLTGYYRINAVGPARCEAVRGAIAARHPVVLGLRLDTAFSRLRAGDVWPGPRGEILGGHAVCAAAYDDEALTIVNSWGLGWADRGWGRVSWEAIADPAVCADLWVPTAVPEVS